MKTVRKVITLIFTMVFFTCVSGFVVTIHHCCQRKSIALECQERCCNCESHGNNGQKSCCDDDVRYIKIQDSFDKKDTPLITKIDIPILIRFSSLQSDDNGFSVQGKALRCNSCPLTPLLTGRTFVHFAHQQVLYA
ncbi:MAG: hypothetical protein LBL18_04405 [Bacteroidales bacterium]|nr:hypothetical protein [Bacteroidales bacterium]